jgi:hypothetical protein
MRNLAITDVVATFLILRSNTQTLSFFGFIRRVRGSIDPKGKLMFDSGTLPLAILALLICCAFGYKLYRDNRTTPAPRIPRPAPTSASRPTTPAYKLSELPTGAMVEDFRPQIAAAYNRAKLYDGTLGSDSDAMTELVNFMLAIVGFGSIGHHPQVQEVRKCLRAPANKTDCKQYALFVRVMSDFVYCKASLPGTGLHNNSDSAQVDEISGKLLTCDEAYLLPGIAMTFKSVLERASVLSINLGAHKVITVPPVDLIEELAVQYRVTASGLSTSDLIQIAELMIRTRQWLNGGPLGTDFKQHLESWYIDRPNNHSYARLESFYGDEDRQRLARALGTDGQFAQLCIRRSAQIVELNLGRSADNQLSSHILSTLADTN